MELTKITKGTFITLKRYNDTPLYIVVKYIKKYNKRIYIYDESVHHFYNNGNYAGAEHFHEAYIFTKEDFNKKITLTSKTIINKILKAFNKANKIITTYPSLKEINEKYKNLPPSYEEQMANVKKIEELENGPWKEEIAELKELEDHYYNKGFRNGFMVGQLNMEQVHIDPPEEEPEDDPDNPFSDRL